MSGVTLTLIGSLVRKCAAAVPRWSCQSKAFYSSVENGTKLRADITIAPLRPSPRSSAIRP